MCVKYILNLFFFLTASIVHGQTDSITDSRDGNSYATIVIGDKVWFQQDLRFETKVSYYPNFHKPDMDCTKGNFYSYKELDTLCPTGWHVSTIEEWEKYIELLKDDNAVVYYDTLPAPNGSITIKIDSMNIDIFSSDNLLNLRANGWVEGKKIKNHGTLTYWINNEEIDDNKYHVHISKNSYVKHTHKHHIDDKPKRQRKFSVRCVCEK